MSTRDKCPICSTGVTYIRLLVNESTGAIFGMRSCPYCFAQSPIVEQHDMEPRELFYARIDAEWKASKTLPAEGKPVKEKEWGNATIEEIVEQHNDGTRILGRRRVNITMDDSPYGWKELAIEVATCGAEVMKELDQWGPRIVPHLIDTDDNEGQRLREAIAKVAQKEQDGKVQ